MRRSYRMVPAFLEVGYTDVVLRQRWTANAPDRQLSELQAVLAQPDVLVLTFSEGLQEHSGISWQSLHPLVTSRAVTVADVSCKVSGAARDVALCCDLVYMRPGGEVRLPARAEPPSAGFVWALARAGAHAVWRGLLEAEALTAAEAVAVGLATAVMDDETPLPISRTVSLASCIAARDLARTRSTRRPALALELATFRFLFAVGDPAEGAAAFLERRTPGFGGGHG